MDKEERRLVLKALDDIGQYVRAGGWVEHREPEPRGRKGPDRAPVRVTSFTIHQPARFDSLRWNAWRAEEATRLREPMPAPTPELQARIAILRSVAYRLAHPSDEHPLGWWQEHPRERTTRFTIDIDTLDLNDLIARITHSFIGRQSRNDALRPGKSEPLPPQPRR